jgi:hypothetical protein
MKIAKLPKGAELHFPDNTSDDVIKAVVKRILGIVEKTVEPEKPVEPQGPTVDKEFETLIATLTESQKKDFYSAAIEKKNKVVLDVSEKQNTLFDNFFKMFIKAKKLELDDNQEHVKELATQIVSIGNQIELLASVINQSTTSLVKAQDSNTDAVYKLVEAYLSPRTIVTDKVTGKPKGIV